MKKAIYAIVLIAIILISSGCLFDDTEQANNLINKANSSIQDFAAIEENHIAPLKQEIDKTDGSKKGASKSLICVTKILNKVQVQEKLITKANQDVSKIAKLAVTDDFKTYAGLTKECLQADIKSLNISKKLYLELQKMYQLIINNNLTQDEYERINTQVEDLAQKAFINAEQQSKLQQKRDAYYLQNLKK